DHLRVRHGARQQRVQVALGERCSRAGAATDLPARGLRDAASHRRGTRGRGSPRAAGPGPRRRPMNLIAGIVYRDPVHPVAPGQVETLLSGTGGAHHPRRIDLLGGVLVGVGTGVVSDDSGHSPVVADLDLTNADEVSTMMVGGG